MNEFESLWTLETNFQSMHQEDPVAKRLLVSQENPLQLKGVAILVDERSSWMNDPRRWRGEENRRLRDTGFT